MSNYHTLTQFTLDSIKSASLADSVCLYYKLLLMQEKNVLNIEFNKECLKVSVIPNYVQLSSSVINNSSRKALTKAKKVWIKSEISRLYSINSSLSYYLYFLYSKLSHKLHHIELEYFYESINSRVAKIIKCKRYKQKRKIVNLVKKQSILVANSNSEHNFDSTTLRSNERLTNNEQVNNVSTDFCFYSRTINKSNTNFTENEIKLLDNGLKYCPKYKVKSNDMFDLCVDLESKLDNVTLKSNLCKIISKSNNNSFKGSEEVKIIDSIVQKVKINNLIVTKADKGNSTVILEKHSYNEKVIQFLDPIKFPESIDLTSKVQECLRKTLAACPNLIKKNSSFKFINMNPRPPRLYGLPKIHKPNNPIRPIVSFVGSPLYKITSHLNYLLKSHLKFKAANSIKNSLELIDKIRNDKPPNNSLLVSFDIVNLFPSVPIKEVKVIVLDLCRDQKLDITIINEIKLLLDLCLDYNYFEFNGKFYLQSEGLPIGSCISPILAEIFLDSLERKILNSTHSSVKHVNYWFRYVDDILCLFTGTRRQLSMFLSFLNSLSNSIKFTLEVEENNCLNFLDLTIKRSNKFTFSVYRKDTFTDTIICANSFHPSQHKMATFHNLIHRLVTVPMSEFDYIKELNCIQTLASNNGFNPSIVQKLVQSKLRKKTLNMIYPNVKTASDDTKWISIPFLGNTSYKIKKVLSRNNFKVSFRTKNSLNAIFNKTRNANNNKCRLSSSGVYKLNCSSCKDFYIGQSGRCFKKRIQEHCNEWVSRTKYHSNAVFRSQFASHLVNNNHHFDPETNIEFLEYCDKGRKLNVLENFHILKNVNNSSFNCINEIIPFNSYPLLSKFM